MQNMMDGIHLYRPERGIPTGPGTKGYGLQGIGMQPPMAGDSWETPQNAQPMFPGMGSKLGRAQDTRAYLPGQEPESQVRHMGGMGGAVNRTAPMGGGISDLPGGGGLQELTSPGTMEAPASRGMFQTRSGHMIPNFTDDDFEWQDMEGQQVGWQSGNDSTPGGAVLGKAGEGSWNLKRSIMDQYGLGDPGNNWEYQFGTSKDGPRIAGLNVKTGKTDYDKVAYTRDASGNYAAAGDGFMSKDTNKIHKMRNLGVGMLLGGGLAANFAGLGAAGSTAGATAGSTAGSLGSVGASTVPGMSVMPGTTGAFGATGAGGAMSVPVGSAAAQAAAGMAPSAIGMTGASAGMGGAAALDLVGKYGPKAAEAIMKQMGGGDPEQATRGGGRGGSGIDDILRLIGGGVDAYHGTRFADELKAQAEAMRKQADPYLQRLNETYENPNSYFQTPEFQALSGMQANKLLGGDAAAGRISNSIDRDKALQDFGAARMNDYRGGLRNAISSVYKPESVASLYGAGVRAEGQAWSPMMAGAGQGAREGGGGDIGSWVDGIGDVIEGGKDVWDWFSDLWG